MTRTALVTGAGHGLGRHMARRLADAGMSLVITGRDLDRLDALRSDLEERGVQAVAFAADLRDPAQIDLLAAHAEAAAPIDILVNNAGIEVVSDFTRCSGAELTEVLAVNLAAPMLLTRAILPGMLARGQGHVVFIASTAAFVSPAYNAAYAASKAGLLALTRALRAEYADSPVGFSTVSPSFVAGDGMYQRMADSGVPAGRRFGTTDVDHLTSAVLRAIDHDRAELIVSRVPVRPVAALAALSPELAAWLLRLSGLSRHFGEVARSRQRGRLPPTAFRPDPPQP